ncbi:MAG TPA: WhiB family transcriptional regulator [Streptosporangiaceae bacterium]|nr:WhiB family transcriptional regulator [Streptosporangiaceae bacterium]
MINSNDQLPRGPVADWVKRAPLDAAINFSLNVWHSIYFSVFTGVQLPCPTSKGAFRMPDNQAAPDPAESLSPQVLEEAAADTKRRWSVHALCTASDPEIFFPTGDSLTSEARDICTQCPVRLNCLAYAITADEPFGIWGGVDPQERRALRRRLRQWETSAIGATGVTA